AKAIWPGIITREDHEALVAVLTAPERDRRGGEPSRRKYLLTGGVARCGLCGAELVARPNGAGKRCYVCTPDHGGCGKIRQLAETFEEFIAEAVIAAVAGGPFDEVRANVAKTKTSRAGVELAAAERRLDELAESYAAGTIGLAAYRKATTRL